jgi:hypothetical protein
LTFSAVAWIALGGAAIFVTHTEQQLATRRAALRNFDLRARETVDAIAAARAGQQAYVAAGQDSAFWFSKVDSLVEQSGRAADDLRSTAVSAEARQALIEGGAAITAFGNVDKRAREYVRTGEPLMAGDVVFTEGGATASEAGRRVETARVAEHQAFDADQALQRRFEAYAAAGAAGFAALVLALLAALSPKPIEQEETAPAIAPAKVIAPPPTERPRGSAPALRAAADLCTEFGRVNDVADLTGLLGRAARMMDASGVIVWLGDTHGSDLRPVLAHGYSEQTLARIPALPRSSDNAAAAAYRTAKLQIVLTRPGTSPGAVAAPIIAPDGCIGALTAEIRDRGETADSVQALAAIFAAQLAGVLAGSVPTAADRAEAVEAKIASR